MHPSDQTAEAEEVTRSDPAAAAEPPEQPGDRLDSAEPVSMAEAAAAVLAVNDRGGQYTVPGAKLYPHQWLWDSCFIAIGLRHLDSERARTEIYSLLRGQWSNGMVPNIVFNDDHRYARDRSAWRSWVSPNSPDHVTTSGITQPPMLAEAVVRIGEKLHAGDKRAWYKSVWPALVAYHQWLYTERDPHAEGLVLLVHPWEAGMDNSPAWTVYLHEHQLPGWIRLIDGLHLTGLIGKFRRDVQTVPIDERYDTLEVLTLFDTQRRLRRKAYDNQKILNHSLFLIEDLAFNAIFVRANKHLRDIARYLERKLPGDLAERMDRTEAAFEQLWDAETGQYYSRNFITHKLLRESTVATLLPLYAGCITQERAEKLVKLMESDRLYGPAYPLPSVAVGSPYFNPMRYWQGPTWMNINWLVIDGLERYGFHEHAEALRDLSLELVEKSGFAEYFDPITGEPLGTDNFSWTAALALDLLKRK